MLMAMRAYLVSYGNTARVSQCRAVWHFWPVLVLLERMYAMLPVKVAARQGGPLWRTLVCNWAVEGHVGYFAIVPWL